MDSTANLGLRLPAGTDYADIADLNYNFEQLDAAMGAARTAEEYDSDSAYAVDAYCVHEGKLYKCTTAITVPEAWNAAHWAETTVAGELKALYMALAGKAAAVHASNHATGGSDPLTPEQIGTYTKYEIDMKYQHRSTRQYKSTFELMMKGEFDKTWA